MGKLIEKLKSSTQYELETQKDCKAEIDKKNLDILTYVIIGCIAVFFGRVLEAVFYYSKANGNHSLTILNIILFAYCAILLAYIKRNKTDVNITALVYITDFILVAYSVVVAAFTTEDEVTVTFVVALFMIHALWVDMSWRINLAAIIATIAYLYVIYWFKPPTIYEVEVVNTVTVAALAAVLGYMLRSSRMESFVTKRVLQIQVYTDSLTGLSNRRRLFEDLARLQDKASPSKATAFALLDIDYFKNYNDSYGHQIGDSCLKKLGDCFLNLQDSNTHFYRYGGEEFVAVFADYERDGVDKLLENLAADIGRLNIEHVASPFKFVTLSIGISIVENKDVRTYESYLTRADIALYKAKELGRNRVVYYSNDLKHTVKHFESKMRQR